jgi:hypothetical protein
MRLTLGSGSLHTKCRRARTAPCTATSMAGECSPAMSTFPRKCKISSARQCKRHACGSCRKRGSTTFRCEQGLLLLVGPSPHFRSPSNGPNPASPPLPLPPSLGQITNDNCDTSGNQKAYWKPGTLHRGFYRFRATSGNQKAYWRISTPHPMFYHFRAIRAPC